jgi:transcriptional regulator with XRE-family HTH domain
VATQQTEREHAEVGEQIRQERLRQDIGVRELARRVSVSPSLISQIERGKATPSVGTLYSIVSELGLSLDELFFPGNGEAEAIEESTAARQRAASAPAGVPADRVVRAEARQALELASGVRWERLTSGHDDDVDFLHVIYDVGGASSDEGTLVRHSGKEFGYILEGTLEVTLGFETYELKPGDAISFDSTTPHRLWNDGKKPAKALWFVVGRDADPRIKSS